MIVIVIIFFKKSNFNLVPRSYTRRKFIVGSSAAAAVSLCRGDINESGEGKIRAMVNAAALNAGYDKNADGVAIICVIGDPHIFLGSEYPHYITEKFDDDLVSEINSLAPLVTDVCIAGDLINYRSITPGIPRYNVHDTWARQEYSIAKTQMNRFVERFRLWAVPGNHDTDAYETDAEMWREMLGIPAYRKAVLGGVPVFFLNSGNGGMLNSGQLTWFRAEAAFVPDDQEVIIVIHHPIFFALREESSMKSVLCEMFGGRVGTVWVVSGHGHQFRDQTFKYRGTLFVQMEITTANPKLTTDDRSPGYILLAMQAGKVVCRLYRSLKESGLESRNTQSLAAASLVKFQFDEVLFRVDTFHEGLYNHTRRIVSYSGVHVGSYFVYLKKITLQIFPKDYLGYPSQIILAGSVPSAVNPICQISLSGADGTWETLVFPGNRGGGLFRIVIPETYRTVEKFLLKFDTGLTGTVAGFNLSGWALAADPSSLSLYARWLQRVYGHLRIENATNPLTITPGTSHVNLTNYAFGLSVPARAGVDDAIVAGVISGLPRYTRARRAALDFRFARRRAESLPGVKCFVERSNDLQSWERLGEDALVVRILDGSWEEVAVSRILVPGLREFLRVGVEEDLHLGDGFSKWRSVSQLPRGSGGDINGNGIEDLLEYAFNLNPASGRTRQYDSTRDSAWAGIPHHGIRRMWTSVMTFTRVKASSRSGISYAVEWSVDLEDWKPLPVWQMDEVEISILDDHLSNRFYRVSVSEI